jgi:hypothetical protein
LNPTGRGAARRTRDARLAAWQRSTMGEIEEGILAQMMVPDILTPAQYYDGVQRDDPGTQAIKRLLSAVLADAVRCFQTYAKSSSRPARRIFAETEAWISDCSARGPFTFEVICETLGIEPGRLRNRLREWRVQQAGGMNPRRLGKRRSPVRSVGPVGSVWRRRRRRRPMLAISQSGPRRTRMAPTCWKTICCIADALSRGSSRGTPCAICGSHCLRAAPCAISLASEGNERPLHPGQEPESESGIGEGLVSHGLGPDVPLARCPAAGAMLRRAVTWFKISDATEILTTSGRKWVRFEKLFL